MKWVFSINNKTKTALSLAIIFILVFAKNVMDNNNVSKPGNSFTSVYEDRLLAESYIYKISNHLYRKRILIDNRHDLSAFQLEEKINEHNSAIATLVLDYEKTKLTENESAFFKALMQNLDEITLLEKKYIINTDVITQSASAKALLDKQFNLASINLNQLSGIQVSEGKLLNVDTKKIIGGSFLLSQFELVLLIAIAVLVQVLIFTSNSIISKIPQKHSLN